MEDIFEYDVFLSYTASDEKIVKPIWQEMCLSGLRVFWSVAALKEKLGESWFDAIEESLAQSRNFLLICSTASMNSKWVKSEYEAFFHNFYNPPLRKLIPFLTKGYENSDLPVLLRQIQTCNADDKNSIKKMIQMLGGVDIEKLKNELSNKVKENHDLHEKLEILEAEIENIKKEKEDFEKRINFYQNEIKTTVLKKEKEVIIFQKKNKELKSKIKEQTEEKEKLEKDIIFYQDEIKKMKNKYLKIPFNPNELTIHDILMNVQEIKNDSDLKQILQMEKDGKNRAGALKHINDRMKIVTKAKKN
ncbi:MAG: TIR domain-containing protein [bacterium]|nr:TIR domain-containing protein [bacterium]